MNLQEQLEILQQAKLEEISLQETLSLEEAIADAIVDDKVINPVNDLPIEDDDSGLLDMSEVQDDLDKNYFNKFQFFNQNHIPQFSDYDLVRDLSPDRIDGTDNFPKSHDSTTIPGLSNDIPNTNSIVGYVNSALDTSNMINYLLGESTNINEFVYEDYDDDLDDDPNVDTSGIVPKYFYGKHLALGMQEFSYVSDPDRSRASVDIPPLEEIINSEKAVEYPPTGKYGESEMQAADRFDSITKTDDKESTSMEILSTKSLTEYLIYGINESVDDDDSSDGIHDIALYSDTDDDDLEGDNQDELSDNSDDLEENAQIDFSFLYK
jgi:hypothetical protein